MPDTSLPELKLWDPNGFTNALAVGQKMRQTQNESDRLAYKDEAAVAKSNALSKFYQSPRGPEDVATLAREAPDAVSGIEKNTREAQLAEVQAKQAKLTWAKANHELLVNGAAAVIANPTRETATMALDSLEAQGGDVTVARMQLQNATDQGIKKLAQGWGMNAQQIEALAQKDREAGQPKVANTTGDGLVTYDPNNPEAGVTPLPGQTQKAPNRPAPRYINTPRGQMLMDPQNPAAPGPIVEGTAPTPKSPKPPTEGQARAGLLVGEAELAHKTMGDLETKGYDPTSKLGAFFDRVADAGGMTTSWLGSAEGQTYLSAAREFVASVAYGKSGASLTETEWENGRQTYIPMPGDSKERREFKAAARARGMQGMHVQAGPADPAAHAGPAAPATAYRDTSPGLAKPQMVHSAEEFARLPSGTKFTAPDGSVRTKP